MYIKIKSWLKEGDVPLNISVKVNPAYIPYLNKPQFLQIFFGG